MDKGDAMKSCVYILKEDTGFAPNPFHGYCTLACCKPDIRSKKNIGEGSWVVGISPKPDYKLIYAMKIEEKLTFEEYWKDVRFQIKKVEEKYLDKSKEYLIERSGDNIYEPFSNGNWKQHPSWHTYPRFSNNECEKDKLKDLSGKYVLVSKKFVYFGQDSKPLPSELEFLKLKFLKNGRGYRCISTKEINKWNEFIEDILSKQHGRVGFPTIWDNTNGKNCIKHKIC